MTDSFPPARFPATRMRRNRRTDWLRRLVRETQVTVDDLIWPVFVVDGESQRVPIESMPGVDRLSCDLIGDAVGQAWDLGIPMIAIFPYTSESLKTPDAREAVNPDNLVCRAVRAIKDSVPDIGVMCDVALDPFNSDGHDGILQDGIILNDGSVEILCQQALAQAQAGCDVIAPSDMMDGRVAAIRSTGKYVSGSDERRTELEDLGFEWRLRNTGAARSGDGQIEPWEVTLRALEIYQARGACESRWGGRHSLSARARALSSLDHGCAGDERELASAEKLRRAAYALLA